MTGPEHYREAERLVRLVTVRTDPGHDGGGHQDSRDSDVVFAHDDDILAAAQVHAMLALAAATALFGSGEAGQPISDDQAWRDAASTKAVATFPAEDGNPF